MKIAINFQARLRLVRPGAAFPHGFFGRWRGGRFGRTQIMSKPGAAWAWRAMVDANANESPRTHRAAKNRQLDIEAVGGAGRVRLGSIHGVLESDGRLGFILN